IEDTDLERSTRESEQAILDGMAWLGLDYDEGPFFQMNRLARYREVAEDLIDRGNAYYCYASREELDALREQQRAAGLKPRYDGRWRPENARGKSAPEGVKPVVRLRNPVEGDVTFMDLVKGPITVSNAELDDLVLMRGDGVPTYNFGVVVDDLDMNITHVIRGDDHVNNTPRQVNILRALGAPLPQYAHVPMILGADGERLSKRHGAVSVMQYSDDGYLPEALLNYLARLGWAHGDAEIFSREQFVEWFDLKAISRSPAKFNPEKLLWLNQQYLKAADDSRLAGAVRSRIERDGGRFDSGPDLSQAVRLFKERATTLNELADALMMIYGNADANPELLAQHLTEDIEPALEDLADAFGRIQGDWRPETIDAALKGVLQKRGLKMPKLAIPLRVVLYGQTQTPSITELLALTGYARVRERLDRYVE
ncbi:MAG TPA: glutamate--tRNA ligase, partial [Burkholderiales bacterium]|nr:glutamate--tRNA ligase [Burkholderiales bacterium]